MAFMSCARFIHPAKSFCTCTASLSSGSAVSMLNKRPPLLGLSPSAVAECAKATDVDPDAFDRGVVVTHVLREEGLCDREEAPLVVEGFRPACAGRRCGFSSPCAGGRPSSSCNGRERGGRNSTFHQIKAYGELKCCPCSRADPPTTNKKAQQASPRALLPRCLDSPKALGASPGAAARSRWRNIQETHCIGNNWRCNMPHACKCSV